MKPKDIKHLFPLICIITNEDRELAIKMGGLHHLGDVLLKGIIPTELHEDIFWGLSIGNIGEVKLKTETTYTDSKGKVIYIPLYLDKNFIENQVIFKLR